MESGREDARAAPRRAGRAAGRGDAAFWPFGARSALVAVPLIALALFAAFALARAIADWPEPRSDNLILAGVLLLSLLPLVLLLLDALATRGGAIEIRGVKIDFAVQLGRRSELTVATNVGVPGVPIPDTSSAQILDTLRAAVANEIAVVDLEDGAAWWETRLLVLCAGAARVGRPAVIVFVATEHAERRCFQGWAPPHPLLQALLRSDRRYRESFYAARAAVSQWSVVPPPGPGQPLPPNPPGATGLAAQHPWIAFTDTNEPNEHAQEQFLAADLGAKAEPPATGLSVVRLRELFAAALYTNAIDRRWSDDRRVEAGHHRSRAVHRAAVTRRCS